MTIKDLKKDSQKVKASVKNKEKMINKKRDRNEFEAKKSAFEVIMSSNKPPEKKNKKIKHNNLDENLN